MQSLKCLVINFPNFNKGLPMRRFLLALLASCIEKTGGVAKYPRANRLELLAERLANTNQASPELLEVLAVRTC